LTLTQRQACGVTFTYARSYRNRADAVQIYQPELPLRGGPHVAAESIRLPLCIDDAMSDVWGRTVIAHRLGTPTAELNEFTLLLQSGSDRLGAVDFQPSPGTYEYRVEVQPTVEDLADETTLLRPPRAHACLLDRCRMVRGR